jgi:hypothetical protein
MKKYSGVAILALVGLGAWVFMWLAPHLRDRSKESASHLQRETTLNALALEHKAIQDWEKTFTNKTSVFTIDVQDGFLNKSAPLEFTGTIEDIRREEGNIVALFTISNTAPFSILLRVICSEEQRKVLTDKSATYAIIADIQKVSKPDGLNVETDFDEGRFIGQFFAVDWDTDTYWVTGACLDLKKLSE